MISAVRRSLRGDAGMTVIEMVVAMFIFMFVVSAFFGGLVIMTRNTVRTEQVTDAGNELRRAFQTLDKQIRYSESINFPGLGASGAHYVEFLTSALPDGHQPLCHQWRFDPTERTLAYRTWRDVPTGSHSDWRTIAWDVRNDLETSGNVPFELVPVVGSVSRQQLIVRLESGRGEAAPEGKPGADISTVFVARNSSIDSPSNADENNNGQSDTPICADLLERP